MNENRNIVILFTSLFTLLVLISFALSSHIADNAKGIKEIKTEEIRQTANNKSIDRFEVRLDSIEKILSKRPFIYYYRPAKVRTVNVVSSKDTTTINKANTRY